MTNLRSDQMSHLHQFFQQLHLDHLKKIGALPGQKIGRERWDHFCLHLVLALHHHHLPHPLHLHSPHQVLKTSSSGPRKVQHYRVLLFQYNFRPNESKFSLFFFFIHFGTKTSSLLPYFVPNKENTGDYFPRLPKHNNGFILT